MVYFILLHCENSKQYKYLKGNNLLCYYCAMSNCWKKQNSIAKKTISREWNKSNM